MMGVDQGMVEVPEVMKQFIDHILQDREGINLPEPLKGEFLQTISYIALRYIDWWDPRFALMYSNIAETSDWCRNTYLLERYTTEGRERGPIQKDEIEKLETYAHVEGQDESYFNEFYYHSKFRYAMFEGPCEILADYTREMLRGGDFSFYVNEWEHEESDAQLTELFYDEHGKAKIYLNENGETEHREGYYTGSRKDEVTLIEHVVEVSVCAALVWFCSPMARRFRVDNHELFWCADRYNEFVMFDYNIYGPDEYEKLPMKPSCCNLCGLDAYCVELVHGIGGQTIQVCNGCLSKNRPPMPRATCGTKFCKHIECPHNKYNGWGERGRYAMDTENPFSYVSYKRGQAPKKVQEKMQIMYDAQRELLG